MHEYSFGSGSRGGNFLKRSLSLSRREVSFEPQNKRRKQRRLKESSNPSSSQRSSVSILTSSCDSKGNCEEESQDLSHSSSKSVGQVSATHFYEKPKSHLEKQYEKNLQKFVSLDYSDDFSPLESMPPSPRVQGSNLNESLQISKVCGGKRTPEINSSMDLQKVDISGLPPDSAEERELHVAYFLNASEVLARKARAIVLLSNDVRGSRVYYTLIKLALKALHFVIKDYRSSLNPALESVIYQRLATLYLKETKSLDKAEGFLNLAIILANKHNLIRLKVSNELLYCELLKQINPSALPSFIAEKEEFYKKEGHLHLCDLFTVIKTKHAPLEEPSSRLAIMETLAKRERSHHLFKVLGYLESASIKLNHGSMSSARDLVKDIASCKLIREVPNQMTAIFHLMTLACYVRENDLASGKAEVEHISHYLASQRASRWAGWNDDGTISVSISLMDSESDFLFEVQWLNTDEFVIMFHFLRGLLEILDPSRSEDTKAVFSACLEIVDLRMNYLTTVTDESKDFGVSSLADRIVKLSYIRYTVIYYKLWVDFSHKSNFDGISSVRDFIECFYGDKFTTQEIALYQSLIPKYLYLAAMYFQANGNINAAKLFYLCVRKFITSQRFLGDAAVFSLQRSLGAGCSLFVTNNDYNELNLYSTFHLVLILEFEVLAGSKMNINLTDRRLKQSSAFHVQLAELVSNLDQTSGTTVERSNDSFMNFDMFALSHDVAAVARLNTTQEVKSLSYKRMTCCFAEVSSSPSVPKLIKVLLSFLIYRSSTDLEEGKKMRRYMMHELMKCDEATRIFGLLIASREGDRIKLIGSDKSAGMEQSIIESSPRFDKILRAARLSVEL